MMIPKNRLSSGTDLFYTARLQGFQLYATQRATRWNMTNLPCWLTWYHAAGTETSPEVLYQHDVGLAPVQMRVENPAFIGGDGQPAGDEIGLWLAGELHDLLLPAGRKREELDGRP